MKKFFAFIALGVLFSESALISTNQIQGLNNVVHYGEYNRILGKDNAVIGHENNINGQRNAAVGLLNELKGENNLVAGVGNSIAGKGNFVGGNGNIVLGPDASEEDKALLNQKMMEMFASRGLGGGPPGLANNVNQVPNNANQPSQVFSGSKTSQNQNQNQKLQPQALEVKSEPQPQLIPTTNSQIIKKPEKTISEPVIQKKQQNTKFETTLLAPSKSQEAYTAKSKEITYDYSLANNEKPMGDDDLRFFDDSKAKPQENSLTSQKPTTKVESKPINTIFVQPQPQTNSNVIAPAQTIPETVHSTQNSQYAQSQPEPKPVQLVQPVKSEVKIVQIKVSNPVSNQNQPTLTSVTQQNQVQSQPQKIQVQQNKTQKIEAKEDVGFKFYVNDGSKSDQSTSNQVQSHSRYSRSVKTTYSEPVIVQVPPRSNLKQDPVQTLEPQVSKPSQSSNVKVDQSSSNIFEDSHATVKPSVVSNTISNVVSTDLSSKTLNGPVIFSSQVNESEQRSTISTVPSSSTGPSSINRYRRENEFENMVPVVTSSTNSLITASSSSSSKPKTAKDVAASYLSGNSNVIMVTSDNSMNGQSSVVNGQTVRGSGNYFMKY